MFGFDRFSLHFLTDIPIWVTLALLILLAAALLLYRRTMPPLSIFWKTVLFSLRLLAIFALIVALYKPIISYSYTHERKPHADILVDISQSMTTSENNVNRLDQVDSVLASPAFTKMQDALTVTTQYYGINLHGEKNNVDTTATALGDVLAQQAAKALSNPPDYLLVFTDGRTNQGQDPLPIAEKSRTPIYTIYPTIDHRFTDIRLTDFKVNPVIFSGEVAEVKVSFAWTGGMFQPSSMALYEDGRQITTKSITFDEETGRGEMTLQYRPTQPGQRLLKVALASIPDEKNLANNSQTIAVTVLKSRLEVLLVSPAIDYELGFIRKYLERSNRYSTTVIMTGNKAGNLKGVFPRTQPELNRFDLLILQAPSATFLNDKKELLTSYLTEKGGAVWVMLDRTADNQPFPGWFKNLLPFYPEGKPDLRQRTFHGSPTSKHIYHPAVRIGDSQQEIHEAWQSLPPFEMYVPIDSFHNQAEILLNADFTTPGAIDQPILGYVQHGPGKFLVQAAIPLWRWGFNPGILEKNGNDFETFLENLANWMTIAEDISPFWLRPERDVYNRGEQVVFNGQAFDVGYRPIPGVTIELTLASPAGLDPLITNLTEIQPGRFTTEFTALNPGVYTYTGQFTKDDRQLHTVSGQFHIEQYSLEEFDQSGNPQLLKDISNSSGGIAVTTSTFDDLLKPISLEKIVERVEKETPVWNRLWLLLLFIGCLSTEWVIRKMNQLL